MEKKLALAVRRAVPEKKRRLRRRSHRRQCAKCAVRACRSRAFSNSAALSDVSSDFANAESRLPCPAQSSARLPRRMLLPVAEAASRDWVALTRSDKSPLRAFCETAQRRAPVPFSVANRCRVSIRRCLLSAFCSAVVFAPSDPPMTSDAALTSIFAFLSIGEDSANDPLLALSWTRFSRIERDGAVQLDSEDNFGNADNAARSIAFQNRSAETEPPIL